MIPQSSVSYDPNPKLMYSAATRASILKPLSSWSPTPKPDWRSESRPMPSIPEMLKEITAMRSLYEANKARPEIQRETETFVMRSAINFIFASNRLDGLGLQSYAQTEEVLTEVWHRSEQSSEDVANAESESGSRFRSRQETVQTLKAMQYLHHDFKEQSQLVRDEVNANGGVENDGCAYANPSFALFIDDKVLCEAHRQLITGLVLSSRAGQFREGDVQANSFFFDRIHHYPPAESIVQKYSELTDTLSELLVSLPASTDANYVELCFKLAAWLLFVFVDLHPFSDGNGRMCRLLANRMLYLVCPFPVAPVGAYDYIFESVVLERDLWLPRPDCTGNEQYCRKRTAGSVQDHYWAAIESCRYGTDDKSVQAADLCALLIENAWAQWQQLFKGTLSPYFSPSGRVNIGVLGLHIPPPVRRRLSFNDYVKSLYKSLAHKRRMPSVSAELLEQEADQLVVLVLKHLADLKSDSSFQFDITPTYYCEVSLCKRM